MAKLAVVTDMDVTGSGYSYLMGQLLTGLSKLGHEIKVSGLSYMGQEHEFPFSIIPARDLGDCNGIINNLHFLWQPDIILVAMDIPIQIQLFQQYAQYKRKYIAITPLENGPLTMSWAAQMFNMDAIFFISELGKQEAIKAGLSKVEHLRVGVDTVFWHPPTPEERAILRKGLGIAEDEFVVLTVADNQERKNLASGMEIVSKLKKQSDKKIRYMLVTRENSPFGWKLRDLAVKLDINQELNIFNRGIPAKDLWGLYAVSNAFLLPSKGEGLSMPTLEALGCGIPVVATDTGALHELLDDGRGWLIAPEYTLKWDVWGNSKRDFINIDKGVDALKDIISNGIDAPRDLSYVRSRTWEEPVQMMHKKIQELTNVTPQA